LINTQGRVAFLPLFRIRLVASRPKPYPEHPRTLGEHIKKRRLELHLTQAQAAKVLMVNPSTVPNWETGQTTPMIPSMPAILAFLGYYPFPTPLTVGERLLRMRWERGWLLREGAEVLGIDPGTWRDWEAGKTVLYRKHRIKVAQLLGLDPQELAEEMRVQWNEVHQRNP
jgi:transcriptional regulator with XRE-family HTH domain